MKLAHASVALAVAMLAGPALAQDSNFAATADRLFSQWDRNGDNRLESDEFVAGLKTTWADGESLDPVAFDEAWTKWFPNTDQPDFASLDENADNRLSQMEFHEGIAAADLSGDWQGADDGYLTPEEFRTGLRAVADANDDDMLDDQEIASLDDLAGQSAASETGATDAGVPEPAFDAPEAKPTVNVSPPCEELNTAAAADCPPAQ